MKTAIILIFVFVLTAGLMAGCRPGSTAESIATEASNIASEIMPDADNGAATDGDGIIHRSHLVFVQVPHMLPEPLFIYGADLLQQYHRILAQAHTASGDIDMGGKPGFAGLAGNGGGNDRG